MSLGPPPTAIDSPGGGGDVYVYPLVRVTVWPGVRTSTVTVPAIWLGAIAVTVVELTTVKVVALDSPNFTE